MRIESAHNGEVIKVVLSERNVKMLSVYGEIHKGSISIYVEPDEKHYTPEQEARHKINTDIEMNLIQEGKLDA